MHHMKWLTILQRFEDMNAISWINGGTTLKFNIEPDKLPLLLEKVSGRKISLPSIKKNMTLYGFRIVNRSNLEFHNPRYTRWNKRVDELTAEVQAKNKVDNDKKKMLKIGQTNPSLKRPSDSNLLHSVLKKQSKMMDPQMLQAFINMKNQLDNTTKNSADITQKLTQLLSQSKKDADVSDINLQSSNTKSESVSSSNSSIPPEIESDLIIDEASDGEDEYQIKNDIKTEIKQEPQIKQEIKNESFEEHNIQSSSVEDEKPINLNLASQPDLSKNVTIPSSLLLKLLNNAEQKGHKQGYSEGFSQGQKDTLDAILSSKTGLKILNLNNINM